jgi:hypothetical protein
MSAKNTDSQIDVIKLAIQFLFIIFNTAFLVVITGSNKKAGNKS